MSSRWPETGRISPAWRPPAREHPWRGHRILVYLIDKNGNVGYKKRVGGETQMPNLKPTIHSLDFGLPAVGDEGASQGDRATL